MSSSKLYDCQRLLTNLNSADFYDKKILENSLFPTFQNKDCVSVTIQHINKLLTTSDNRLKGLELLNNVVLSLPIETVISNAIVWIKIILNFSSQEADAATRYNVLSKLLEMKLNNQDFHKTMVSAIPKIIDLCLAIPITSKLNRSSLHCLKTCLQRYPTTCGPYRKKIELYLCKYLQKQLPLKSVQQAATTFHFLQQAGGSGPDIYAHRNNWTAFVYKLCSTLNEQYNKEFFTNITEFTNYSKTDQESFEFYSDERDNIQERSVLCITAGRVKNIVTFLNSFLLEEYCTEKMLSVQIVFDVIRRGLTIDTYTDYSKSFESIEFTALLYDHQIDLLYLLRSLMLCVKQNIMPFSFIITKLLMDCLKRTQKDYFKLNTKYQEAVYAVLNHWISLSKNKFCKTVHNKLVSLILSEISYVNEEVKLTINDSSTKSKKRKHFVTNPIDITSATTQHFINTKEKLCAEALNTGSCLLNHVALQLETEVYKQLCETVIQNIINLQKGKSKPPYSNSDCQMHLYEMLLSIFNQPYFCAKPYLPTAVNLFVIGTKSNEHKIGMVCIRALNNLEKLCQATCPVLNQGFNPINNFRDTNEEEDFVSAIDTLYNSVEDKVVENDDATIQNVVHEKEPSQKIHILSNEIIKPTKVKSVIKVNEAAMNIQENVIINIDESENEEEAKNVEMDKVSNGNTERNKRIKLDNSEKTNSNIDDKIFPNQVSSIEVDADDIPVNGVEKENGCLTKLDKEDEFDEDEIEMLNSLVDEVIDFE